MSKPVPLPLASPFIIDDNLNLKEKKPQRNFGRKRRSYLPQSQKHDLEDVLNQIAPQSTTLISMSQTRHAQAATDTFLTRRPNAVDDPKNFTF
jgi:hypothetical protein